MRTNRRSATIPVQSDEQPDTDPTLAAESGRQQEQPQQEQPQHEQLQGEPAADGEPDDVRHRRIAERAYRRAAARGFAPGRELDDWLAAEAEERDDDETDRRAGDAS
jgi:Protein of unknown function (DUF2934)